MRPQTEAAAKADVPSEIGVRTGPSTLFAAWSAVIYVNQVGDERLDEVVQNGSCLKARPEVLNKHGGLWFNDEKFVVSRRHQQGETNERDEAR